MCSRGHWYACVQYCKKKWRLGQVVRSVLGAFLLLPSKKKFSETSGLCHNSLCPKCNLAFFFFSFFPFFSAKLVYNLARETKKKKKKKKKTTTTTTTRPGQNGHLFCFFFLGCGKDGLK